MPGCVANASVPTTKGTRGVNASGSTSAPFAAAAALLLAAATSSAGCTLLCSPGGGVASAPAVSSSASSAATRCFTRSFLYELFVVVCTLVSVSYVCVKSCFFFDARVP